MENDTKPKWDLGATIRSGDEAHALATKYISEIEKRLKPDELTQFEIHVDALAKRRPAQQENLITQKSKTQGQEEIKELLHKDVISVRRVVKANNASNEIQKAYGVGENMNNMVSSVIAAGNIVVKAYDMYKDWSTNEAGILEEDIAEIANGIKELEAAAGIQNSSVIGRKDGTMDKNVLQRMVEDEITRISAIGSHAFRKKNPAVATMFENLIPNGTKSKAPKGEAEESKA